MENSTTNTQQYFSRRNVLVGTSAILAASTMPSFGKGAIAKFNPKGSASFDHGAFSQILGKYVKRDGDGYNRFDYAGMKSNRGSLTAYLNALTSADPTKLSRNEAHAYWINLYNAKTLDIVVGKYPVSSIKKINLGGGGLFGSGPWSKPLISISGTNLSLDDVEHRIVRALFKDPMSHYGLNCASYSCPNLASKAYTGGNIKALLAQTGRDYIGHNRGVRVRGGKITASKIFSWYDDDFGGKRNLKAHWMSLATPAKAAEIKPAKISKFTYDWSLNDV